MAYKNFTRTPAVNLLDEGWDTRNVSVTAQALLEPEKHQGVAMLPRQLAFEWGPRGIRSNSISPGLIRTPLSESFYQAFKQFTLL